MKNLVLILTTIICIGSFNSCRIRYKSDIETKGLTFLWSEKLNKEVKIKRTLDNMLRDSSLFVGRDDLELVVKDMINEKQIFTACIIRKYNPIAPYAGEKYFLDIGIKSNSELIINNVVVKPDSISLAIKGHFVICDNLKKPIYCHEKEIPFIGLKKIPHIVYYMLVEPDDTGGINDWDLFYNILRDIVDLYIDKREQYSQEFFGEEYYRLSFKKKRAIISYRPILIIVKFGKVPGIFIPKPAESQRRLR
ncbi:hypothetical protein EYV94_22870 [Puteibacter caeruleilacunae]|nr:hypothetical protein EYV94_22870 [Puteibacter caeruleilacunae]